MLRCTHVDDQDSFLHLTDFDLLYEAFPFSSELHISYAIKSSALGHIQDCISLHLNYIMYPSTNNLNSNLDSPPVLSELHAIECTIYLNLVTPDYKQLRQEFYLISMLRNGQSSCA